MIDWDSEHDPQLSRLASKCDPPPVERLDLEALRRAVHEQALPILARRKRVRLLRRWTTPAGAGLSLAAAAILAALLVGSPDTSNRPRATPRSAPTTPEAVVTADLPEDEFRALVSGAADTRSLLLLAAGEL